MTGDHDSGALPHGLEHIGGIAERQHAVLDELRPANRTNGDVGTIGDQTPASTPALPGGRDP